MVIERDEEADRLALFLTSGAVIGDPTSLPGLSYRIERDAVPKEGTPFDTQRTTGEKVDCALCGRRSNHFKGFVVTFSDGRVAIIGRNCGETQLFDNGAWAEMAAKSERRKMAALYAARSAPTVMTIDRLLPTLKRCEDEVALIDDLLSEVHVQLPDLFIGLALAAKRGGQLTREVITMVTAVGRDGKERQVEDRRLKVFATLPTIAPFAPGGLVASVAKVRKGLERVRVTLDQEGLTLVQQGHAFQLLRTLGADLREAQSEAEKSRRFLSPSFWEDVAKWGRADHEREGNYRVVRGTIRHSDKDYLFGEVRLPASDGYQLASITLARSMWPKL